MACSGCILVVDDDRDLSDALKDYIQGLGCSVVLAVDGLDALDCLDRHPHPCLVLLDINMPRMDGGTFARAVRQHAKHRDVAIISMSAGSEMLGPPEVHCHLCKPLSSELIDGHIAQFCPEERVGVRRD